MKPLRILHTEASCGWGGQEIRILEESVGLLARGHDVRLVAPAAADISDEAERRSIPIYRLPIDKRRKKILFALRRLIRELAPDAIVTHSSTDSWLVSLSTRFLPETPPIVRLRHISAPVKANRLNRWLYGRVPARVVTTGEALRHQLISGLDLEPSRVVSIPTGVDLDRFSPGNRAAARQRLGLPDGVLIGVVATLRKWKGHRFLIQAMRESELALARLVVVGDGPQADTLAGLRHQLGLDGRVVFAGRQDDVVPWLRAFDLFSLPSTDNEGVPQALMQAMACGVPVVTTPVGAIKELVADGETGLLVPPEAPEALAKALGSLICNPQLAARLSSAARGHVAARYSKKAMLDAMEALLKDTVGRISS